MKRLFSHFLFLVYFNHYIICETINEKPCHSKDLDCIRLNTQKFLEKTSAGLPTLGLKPIDPIAIDCITIDLTSMDAQLNYHDINITGLKNLQIEQFSMDTDKMLVSFSVFMRPTVSSKATYKQTKPTVTDFEGSLSQKFKLTAKVAYPYSITKDAEGIDHYTIGKEDITYKLNPPSTNYLDGVTFFEGASHQFVESMKKASEDKSLASKIIDIAVPIFVHNIRQSAKHLPMSTFFKDD